MQKFVCQLSVSIYSALCVGLSILFALCALSVRPVDAGGARPPGKDRAARPQCIPPHAVQCGSESRGTEGGRGGHYKGKVVWV